MVKVQYGPTGVQPVGHRMTVVVKLLAVRRAGKKAIKVRSGIF